MITMNTYEFLNRYQKAVRTEQNLRDEINRLDDRIGIPSRRMDGLPTKHEPQHVTEDMALQLIELKRDYEKQILQCVLICEEVFEAINQIPDATGKRLLYLKYCANKTWDEVAFDIHYSTDYTQKELHAKAIELLGVVLNG